MEVPTVGSPGATLKQKVKGSQGQRGDSGTGSCRKPGVLHLLLPWLSGEFK